MKIKIYIFAQQANSYTISKHAVVCLTKCFADKKAKTDKVGVRAYALCPFFANTKLVSDEIDIGMRPYLIHYTGSLNNYHLHFFK